MTADDLVLLQEAVQLTTAGHHRKALGYLKQYLSRARAQKDRCKEYSALLNAGVVFLRLHEPRKALQFLGESLSLIRELLLIQLQAVSATPNHAAAAAATGWSSGGMTTDSAEHSAVPASSPTTETEAVVVAHAPESERGGEATAAEKPPASTSTALSSSSSQIAVHSVGHLRRSEAKALTTIGAVYALLGMRDTAMMYQCEALTIGESEVADGDDSQSQTRSSTSLSSSSPHHEMDLAVADPSCSKRSDSALDLTRRRQWGGVLSAVCHNLALIESERGHYRRAFELLDKAVEWAEVGSDDWVPPADAAATSSDHSSNRGGTLIVSSERSELERTIAIVKQRHDAYRRALKQEKSRGH